MKRDGIIRVIVYSIIVVLLMGLAIEYSYAVYHSGSDLLGVSDTKDVYVDGTDFTDIVKLIGHGINGVLLIMTRMLCGIIILIASIIFLLPFKLIGLRSKYSVTQVEYAVYKYSFIGTLVLSLLVSFILTRFTGVCLTIIYNLIWALFVYLFVVRPAKKMSTPKDEEEQQ